VTTLIEASISTNYP